MSSIVIGITTYDRFQWLSGIVDHLRREVSSHDFKIVIVNDFPGGSADVSTIEATIFHNQVSYGRTGYWITVNKAMEYAQAIDPDYFICLPDDIMLCRQFLNRVVDRFEKAIDEHPKVGVMNLIRDYRALVSGQGPGCGIFPYTDGCNIFTRSAMESLQYRVWKVSNKLGEMYKQTSMVWNQVSGRLSQKGIQVFMPEHSYTWHLGHTVSMMHPKDRRKVPLRTEYFIDDMEDEL